MQVVPKLLPQAVVEPKSAPQGKPEGFAAQLKARTDGAKAPPGPEPPSKDGPPKPATAKGGEVAKNEPNAHSQKPDSQPKQSEINETQTVLQISPALAAVVSSAAPTSPNSIPTPTKAQADVLASEAGVAQDAAVSLTTPAAIAQAKAPSSESALATQTSAERPEAKSTPAQQNAQGRAVVATTPASTKSRLTRTGEAPERPAQAKATTVKLPREQAETLNVKSVTVEPDGREAKQPAVTQAQVATLGDIKDSATKTTETGPVSHNEVVTAKQGSGSGQGQLPSEDQDEKPASKNLDARRGKSVSAVKGDNGTNSARAIKDEPAPEATQNPRAPEAGRKIVATPIMQPEAVSKSTQVAVASASRPITREEVSNVVRQAADRVALLTAARSKEAVVVRLNPVDLGELTISVKSAAQRVDVQVTASNENVKQSLQHHACQLGQSLSQRGLELNSLTFGSQSNTSTQSDSTAQQRAAQGQQHARQQSVGANHQQSKAGQPASFAAPSDGVDLRI